MSNRDLDSWAIFLAEGLICAKAQVCLKECGVGRWWFVFGAEQLERVWKRPAG